MEEQERVMGLMSSASDVTTVFNKALPVIAELLLSVCQPGTHTVQRN